ncbi:MAG: DUF3131 domain-containing protein [Candidatus Omnitrophica bacterium]|nr:DUF3131 domain-containing protein [Candidatus Omnitrophota bacterium]
MKKIVGLVCLVMLFVMVTTHAALADQESFRQELIAAGIPAGDPTYLADYWAWAIFNDAGARTNWQNAGFIVSDGALTWTLTAYGRVAVYDMLVRLANQLSAIGMGSYIGEYLYYDDAKRIRWASAGYLSIQPSNDTNDPTQITITANGNIAIPNMVSFADELAAAGIPNNGTDDAYADFIFTDPAFRQLWLDARFITTTLSGSVITDVNLTEYGHVAAGDMYNLIQAMMAASLDQWAAERIALQLFGDASLREALVAEGVININTSSQGLSVWGMSSCTDPSDDSTYRDYYAPLGMSHGAWILNESGVVTPYASFLALDVAPAEAMANIGDLSGISGMTGTYGFLDSVNATNNDVAQVYLTLSQGCILVSIANALNNGCIQDYFMGSNPLIISRGRLNKAYSGILTDPTGAQLDTSALTDLQKATLLGYAQSTWNYFADTTNAGTYWLPPDRRTAAGSVANYTSITDIALYLMSVVAADELNLIDSATAQTRITNCLATLATLDKWNGLFHNYYSFTTNPPSASTASEKFISTVDNGWLASALLVVRQAYGGAIRTNADALFNAMNFNSLYNTTAGLLATGADPDTSTLTTSYYGNIYTEIRPTILIAIGKTGSTIPAALWDRMVTAYPEDWTWQAQIPSNGVYDYTIGSDTFHYIPSWEGTMFEALMPNLVIDNHTYSASGFAIQDRIYVYLQKMFATGLRDAAIGADAISVTTYGQTAFAVLDYLVGKFNGYGIGAEAAVNAAILLFTNDNLRNEWVTDGYITVTTDGSGRITNITITAAGDLALPGILAGGSGSVLAIEIHEEIIAHGLQSDFQILYGTAVSNQVLSNNDYMSILVGIAGYISEHDDYTKPDYYTVDDFIYELGASADLHQAIIDNSLQSIVAAISNYAPINQNPVNNPAYRGWLAGVVNGTGYNLATYIAGLNGAMAVHNALDDVAYPTLRADFELIYGVAVADQVLEANMNDPDYLSTIQGIAGYIASNTIGYDIEDFKVELVTMADLHEGLTSNAALRADFESMYNVTYVADPETSDDYRFTLSGIASYIASHPPMTAAAFLNSVPIMADIHAALLADPALRADFETINNVTADTTPNVTTESYRYALAGMASYVLDNPPMTYTDLLDALPIMADIHAALLADPALRADFNIVYNTTADTTPNVTSTGYRNVLAGIASYALANSLDFNDILDAVPYIADIHAELLASATLRADFNAIYGVDPDTTPNVTSDNYRNALSGVASYILGSAGTYTVSDFVSALPIMADLDEAISADINVQSAFETIYGIEVANQDPVTNADYRNILSGVASYIIDNPPYSVADFTAELPVMENVHEALQADALLQADFETIYGIAPADQDPITNDAYRFNLSGIASFILNNAGYTVAIFMDALELMADLHEALAADPTGVGEDFASVYGIAVADQDPVTNADYRNILSGVANYILANPPMTVNDFLASLPIIDDLHAAISADPDLQADFETIYGIAVADQDPVNNPDYANALSGIARYIVTTPGYTVLRFTQALPIMADLDAAITASADIQNDFEVIYGIAPANQDPVTNENYRNLLSGTADYILDNAGYTVGDFVGALTPMADIHAALLADASLRADFNVVYNVTADTTPSVTTESYRYALSGIASYVLDNPPMTINDILSAIPIMADIHQALVADAGLRADFNTVYNTIADSGANVTTEAYRYALSGIASYVLDEGLTANDILNAIPVMADLHAALLADADLQADFTVVYNVVADTTANVTTESYRYALAGMAAYILDNGLTTSDLLDALPIMADLHAALLADAALRVDFEVIYSVTADTTANITGENYRYALSGIASYILANAGTTIDDILGAIPYMQDIHAALLADPGLRADFNIAYNTTADTTATVTSEDYRTVLSGIGAYVLANPGITVTDILNGVPYIVDIHQALLADASLRADFNTVYGVTPDTTASVQSDNYRAILSGVASYIVANSGSYGVSDFTGALSHMADIHEALVASADLQADFLLMYGVAVATPPASSNDYLYILSGIASYMLDNPTYTVTTFTTELSRMADLHQAIIDNDLREEFAIRSGISVADQIAITGEYRSYLAAIVMAGGYNQANEIAFLQSLTDTVTLHDALGTNELRDEFELMYGTPVAEQILTNGDYTNLIQGIAAYINDHEPAYTLNSFLTELAGIAELHLALDTYNLRVAFAAASGIAVSDQDPVAHPDTYRAYLSGVVNGPGYTLSGYLATLSEPGVVHDAIVASNLQADFSLMYGTPIDEQLMSNSEYVAILQEIVIGIGGIDNLSEFLSNLAAGAELHRALDIYDLRDEFASQEFIAVELQDPVNNSSYRGRLFGLVSTSGYTLIGYLTGIGGGAIYTHYPSGRIHTKTTADGTVSEYDDTTVDDGGTQGDLTDDYGRLIKETLSTGYYMTREYYPSTNDRKLDSFYTDVHVVYETKEYFEDGTTLKFHWMLDQDSTPDGDVTFREYNSSGLLIKEVLDTGYYFTREYFPSTTDRKLDTFYTDAHVIYETKEYFTNGTTLRYHWMLDQDGIVDGDIVFEEYDSLGNLVMVEYDTGVKQYTSENIFADFGINGFFKYNGISWTKLSAYNADSFMLSKKRSDNSYDAIVDFGGSGFYRYSNNSWSKLSGWNADSFMLSGLNNDKYDVVADFGLNGMHRYSNNTWTKLTGWNADFFMLTSLYGGTYDIISDFGGTIGFYKYSGSSWTKLSGWNADSFTLTDRRTDGSYDIVTDFGGNGLYKYVVNSWTKLSGWNADCFTVSKLYNDAYDVVADFGGSGFYRYSNNSWTKLSGWNADSFTLTDRRTDGSYDIITDFGINGLYKYAASSWTRLTSWNAEYFALSQLNNGVYDIVADFGVNGLYKYANSIWTKLSGWDADSFMLTVNNNTYDIIADFGAKGLYKYSNNAWTQLSTLSPDLEVSQRLDVQNSVTPPGATTAEGGYTLTSSLAGGPTGLTDRR